VNLTEFKYLTLVMVKNPIELENLEKEFQRQQKLTLPERFRIFESLYTHARLLDHFTDKNKLDGLDETVELVRKLHTDDPQTPR
jgi:hypothetical protein